MDIGDYTSRLNSARKDFQDQIQNQRKDFERNIENQNDRHRRQQVKQKKAYLRSINKMAEEAKENKDSLKDQSNNAIKKKKSFFIDKLKEKENDYRQERTDYRKRFQRDLSDLKEEYKNSVERKSDAYNSHLEDMDEKFNKRLRRNTEHFQNKIQNLNEDINNNLKKINKETAWSNQKMKDDFTEKAIRQEDKHRIKQEKNRRLNDNLLEKVNDNFQKYKEKVQRRENYLEEKLENQQKDLTHEKISGFKEFNDSIKQKLRENRNSRDIIEQRESLELKRKEDKLDRLKRKDQRAMEIEKRALERKGDELIPAMKMMEQNTKNRVKKYHHVMREDNLKNQQIRDDLINDYKKSRTERNFLFGKKIDDIKKDSYESKAKKILKNTRDSQKVIDNYQFKLSDLERKSHDAVTRHKRYAADFVRDNNIKTAEILKDNNEKTIKKFNKLSKQNKEIRSEIIDKAHRESHIAQKEIRNEFTKIIERKDENHNEKIKKLEKQYDKIQDFYKNKMERIVSVLMRELQFKEDIYNERVKNDKQVHKDNISLQTQERERAILKLKNEYDYRMSSIRKTNELAMNDTIQKYEDQIRKMNLESNIKLKKRIAELVSMISRLKKDHEFMIDDIKRKYEHKIKNIQDNNIEAHKASSREHTKNYNKQAA